MILYFAYGSNLHPGQMAWRCPPARPIGVAALGGYAFRINKIGAATIVPDGQAEVMGVVWRCTPTCVSTLDKHEGVAQGVYRRAFVPILINGRPRRALTYIATNRSGSHNPARGYLSRFVMGGARTFGFSDCYVTGLGAWEGTHVLRAGRRRPVRTISQWRQQHIMHLAAQTNPMHQALA